MFAVFCIKKLPKFEVHVFHFGFAPGRELNYAITSSPLEKRYEVTVLLAEVDRVVG